MSISQTKSSESKNSIEFYEAKERMREIERELASAIDLLNEFENTIPTGYNRFLQVTTFGFIIGLFFALAAVLIIHFNEEPASVLRIIIAAVFAVPAVYFIFNSGLNVFTTLQSWRAMSRQREHIRKLRQMRREAEEKIKALEEISD